MNTELNGLIRMSETVTSFECTSCEWNGPSEDVEWGMFIPPGQDRFFDTPTNADCPECGSEIEVR